MKFFLLILFLFSSQLWAYTDPDMSETLQPIVLHPNPVGTPNPSNIEDWNNDWIKDSAIDFNFNSSKETLISRGAVGLKCGENYNLHDLWLPRVMQLTDSPDITLYIKALESENHIELLNRVFTRIDRTIPSLSAKLRSALDLVSINYVKGPLKVDGIDSLFKGLDPKCQVVRFSHRKIYAYGSEVYVDQTLFNHPGVTVTTKAAIILHELISLVFEKELKTDREVSYSGIVSTILANQFNYNDLLDRVSTLGFSISDTYPYKAIAQYRAKLIKEKSSWLGILLMKKQTQLCEALHLIQETARELKQQFSQVQHRQYTDYYSLDRYMNLNPLSIAEQFNMLNDMTIVMDRLFKIHDFEILNAQKAIQELKGSNDSYASVQIRRFNQKIEDLGKMIVDQEQLKSKFDAIKRLNDAFVAEINSVLLERLTRIHKFEKEELEKFDDIDTNILKSIIEKREIIFNEITQELK